MAEIRDIVAEQSYAGNAVAGGGSGGVLAIDVQPVLELAKYKMFENKANYDQRQKDIDAKIAELAEFTALDLNGTRAKDKDYLVNKWDEVQKISEEYARYTPTSQKDKVEKQLEYQKKLQQLKFDVNSGNKRAIAYNVRLNAINQSPDDAATKDAKLKKLNNQFDKTDITTPIPAEDNYSIEIPKIGEPVYSVNAVTQKDANGALTSTFKLFAPRENNAAAFAEGQGIIIEALPANATETQKEEYAAKQRAYKKAGHTLYQDAATAFNEAINDAKYKNADGSVNYDQIKADNPLLASTVKLIDDWNNYSTTRKAQIESGAFFDRTGSKPLASLVSANDYFIIDKEKPLTAQNLIFLQKFKDAVPDGKQEKYDYTGESIQQQNATTARMRLGIDDAEFKLKEKQWEASQKGGETVKNGAMEFAKNLYGQLVSVADEKFSTGNGSVISPDKLRQLNSEQLKYLGVSAATDKGGYVLNSLALPADAAIVLEGNNIRVLEKASKGSNGKWYGQYNNALSTTITNVATNRLNEQLKNAGAKELNSYLPIDIEGSATVSENNTQSTSTQSSSSNTLSTDAADWKQEGKNWRYKDGSLYDSKGKKIN